MNLNSGGNEINKNDGDTDSNDILHGENSDVFKSTFGALNATDNANIEWQ